MSSKKNKDQVEVTGSEEAPEVAIDFYVPEEMLAIYSDTALVQHTQNEFIISFFQVPRPYLADPEAVKKIKSLKARCVSRIVVSPNQMQQLLEALTTNYEKYMAKQDKPKNDL